MKISISSLPKNLVAPRRREHPRRRSGILRCALILIPLPMLGACASVDPSEDYDLARAEVASATGVESLYRPGDEDEIEQRVEELLGEGLALQEAVEVCLLNNAELQARLIEIGIRRADVVQAGLLSNPTLGALLRLPFGGGASTTEVDLVQNVIELWQIGPRERMAKSFLRQGLLEVSHTAAQLVAETKQAYLRVASASAGLEVAEQNQLGAESFHELILERQRAGAGTQVDVNAALSESLIQDALLREARFLVFDAKREFALLLGLAGDPRALQLSDDIPELSAWSMDLPRLLDYAHESRLDLRAARQKVAAAQAALALEKRSVWRNLGAGISLESEGGATKLGPAINLELPIFDQNQAQVAKAEYKYVQAQRLLQALTVRVEQEVRGAHARLLLARDRAALYRDQLMPLQRSSLELAQESFAEGKTGFLSVLRAQQQLLATRREFVQRLGDVALGLPELERTCGRPIQVLLMEDSAQDDSGAQP